MDESNIRREDDTKIILFALEKPKRMGYNISTNQAERKQKMNEQIKQLKNLKETVALWEDQKYYDDQARQEAAMSGRRHKEENTEKVTAKLREAEAALATFVMWNCDVVEALEELEDTEAKAATEQAIKSAWNS